ncbi:Acetyl-CoA acetyltransferase [Rubrobacter xylanophilus DSM 9941]|uniref:thiolase family protein n=1 Tax=Rubrobacter xylanophilus TaxID=49319 RepID=UPI001C64033A|nr:thiolase family protein [Rubrobacter xylanophilus]QYJ15013.1 Acetyl-CoA acetyltransferase [Rubrobacter xylanophilus DSM 9941]
MRFRDACIPAGFLWSSPFARWQGPLAEVSGLELAVRVTGRALEERRFDPGETGSLVFGWTVPQKEIFYGAPTLAARLGAPAVTGPMISQACATSVACLAAAAASAGSEPTLVVTADRTSNGPTLLYPNPSGMGGAPEVEHWVLDAFARDPWAGESMVATAEAVAAEEGITREELDEVTLLRYEQYREALADDRAFQRRYMVPVEVPRPRGKPLLLEEDHGVYPTTREGLAKLKPVTGGGVVTFGSQTHPADGAAGALVTTGERARELGGGEGVVRLLAVGFARVERARMPKAPFPAALAALEAAGLDLREVDAVKTHNPFAVNDVYLSRKLGLPQDKMNNYGSSLVFGHPQGPTGLRLIAELVEELRLRGGGVGLFTGCAAGDSGAALVLRVED